MQTTQKFVNTTFVNSTEEHAGMQDDLNKLLSWSKEWQMLLNVELLSWSKEWQMLLNVEKSKVMHFG